MSHETVWNDEAREDLRETLRSAILGEIRLANRNHAAILESCREVYIEDECPENERETFKKYAEEELKRVADRHSADMATWPKETDCDRLDRVESVLRDRGILLWQVSPCCDTCTGSELPDRIDAIEDREPGFRERVRGYAFFIDQNLPEMLSASPQVDVYLAYGWFSHDDSEPTADVYEEQALAIAREVCGCLRDEGFEVDWNGELDRKIGVALTWQRRTLLE